MARVILLFAVPVLLVGCGSWFGEALPTGDYFDPAHEESISLKGRDMSFHLRIVKGQHTGEMVKRTCSYWLQGSEISVSYPTSDEGYLWSVALYHWYWDGKNIIRRRYHPTFDTRNVRDDDAAVIFTREPPQ